MYAIYWINGMEDDREHWGGVSSVLRPSLGCTFICTAILTAEEDELSTWVTYQAGKCVPEESRSCTAILSAEEGMCEEG